VIEQSATSNTGCALGCLGGLLFGLFGGAALAVIYTLATAVLAPDPQITPAPPTAAHLSITLTEDFLNRFVEQPANGSFKVDIQPDNRVQVNTGTVVQAMGVAVPVQVTGLFGLTATPQALQVKLLNTQVTGINLDLTGIFDEDITLMNQNMAAMVRNISQAMGVAVSPLRLTTTDTAIQVDLREAP